MAGNFKRTRRGIEVRLDGAETMLLIQVLQDVRQMVSGESSPLDPAGADVPDWASELGLDDLGTGAVTERPADPALARLLPTASDDRDAAAEFRRYTERSLRTSKRAAIDQALRVLERDSGERITRFTEPEAVALDRALTDVRLVMAERLGIETDEDAEALHAWLIEALNDPPEDDAADVGDNPVPAQWLAQVYEFLTWLQESLSEVLLAALPDEGDGRRQPPPLSES